MDWVTLINTALPVIISAIIIPLLVAAGKALGRYIKTEQQKKYYDMACDAVIAAVAETMMTFVDELKKAGKWNSETAKKAFDLARAKALKTMGAAVLQAMPEIVGDFEAWLSAQIEAATLSMKEPAIMEVLTCEA
jgi:polyhydroxyalkanoate synthesis regulator phasin